MICVACGEPTNQVPCAACGEEPRLDGRYALLDELGRGAAGVTWKGDHDGHIVAIKESQLQRGDASKVQELVHREARVLEQLSHSQIPAYVDEIWVESGRSASLFLVQDHVDGVDLKRRLKHHRYTEVEVLEVLLDLCGVLSYLHGLTPPVIHRDLKPANVIHTADGTHVLVDFGSVRDALKDADLGGSTVAGTFGYMAPEQFAGDAEPRSDLYALGALGVALLTRKDPSTLQAPDRTLRWRDHATVTHQTARLIDDCLALDPEDRPASAEVVAMRIRPLLDPTQAPPQPRAATRRGPTSARSTPATRPHAEPPPAQTPESFHQPPANRSPQVLLLVGTSALVMLLLGGGVALLVLTSTRASVTTGADAPAPVETTPPQPDPEAQRLFRQAVNTPAAGLRWPVLDAETYASLDDEVTCVVEREGDTQLSVEDGCPEPLVAPARQWAVDHPGAQVAADFGPPPPEEVIVATTSTRELRPHPDPDTTVEVGALQVLERRAPSYPEVARDHPIASVRCALRIDVNTTGRADGYTIEECPAAFHEPIHDMLDGWVWAAPESPVKVPIAVSFQRQ